MLKFKKVRYGSVWVYAKDDSIGLLKDLIPLEPLLKQGRLVKKSTYKSIFLISANTGKYLVKEHSRKRMLRPNKAIVEYMNSLKVGGKGIDIIPFKGVIVCGKKGYLISPYIEGVKKLSDVQVTKELIKRYASFCRKVLFAGVFQYDFNPTNVLLDGSGRFYLCDFEHISFKPPFYGRICWVLARLSRYNGVSPVEKLYFLKQFFEKSNKEALSFIAREIDSIRRKYGY